MSDKLLEENGFLVIDSDNLGDTDPMDIVREIYAQRSRNLWKGVDTSRAVTWEIQDGLMVFSMGGKTLEGDLVEEEREAEIKRIGGF